MAKAWTLIHETVDRVVVSFRGKLKADEGRASAEAFARTLIEHPVDVVWDLRSMTGYETEARVAWQQVLWPYRHHIRSVTVVGGGALVRLGAITLTTLLGVPLTFRDEKNRIE